MARKKKVEEHENHERWLVSYADFITLLFAFFVVMYSMSSVNEGKYRVLSDSMVAAFSPSTRSLNPIQIGELVRAPQTPFVVVKETPQPLKIAPIAMPVQPSGGRFYIDAESAAEANQPGEGGQQLDDIAANVAEFFEELIEDEQILVRRHPLWLEVEIKSNILFNSGSAVLAEEAEAVLMSLGVVLDGYSNRILVEGFTDNTPITNAVYPSNWELSSARAAMVIRSFEGYDIDPTRMASVGYGEFKPASDNDSAAGRAENRRVIIVVMTDQESPDREGEISSDDFNLLRLRNIDSPTGI